MEGLKMKDCGKNGSDTQAVYGGHFMKMVEMFCLCRKNVTVEFYIFQIGEDYLVAAVGGDEPHIGAVSLNDRVLSAPEHREDAVTSVMAEIIRSKCPGNICVTAGIHVNQITKEQIGAVMDMCASAAERIMVHISANTRCFVGHMPKKSEDFGAKSHEK